MRTVRVAAIQATSLNGQPDRNLANATRLVENAAAQGASLIVCPEFLATGYVYDESIWDSGEPAGGRTEQWLADIASRLGVVVGAGWMQAEGDEFYNVFSLFDREGRLLGRVRKASLPIFEGWYFAPCPRDKVVPTEFGNVGVGICNDNQTSEFLAEMNDTLPDLIVMPHSAPTPLIPGFGLLVRVIYERQLDSVAQRYARALGIPVVMANKISHKPWRTAIPLVDGVRLPLTFRGHSRICDGNGETLAYDVGSETALVATVSLDPDRKHTARVRREGYWSFPPVILGRVTGGLMRWLDRAGQRSYRANERRRVAARGVGAKA